MQEVVGKPQYEKTLSLKTLKLQNKQQYYNKINIIMEFENLVNIRR